MAVSVTGCKTESKFIGTMTKTQEVAGSQNQSYAVDDSTTWTDGSGADAIDNMVIKINASIAGAATVNYDLAGDATFVNLWGEAVTFIELKGILFHNTGTTKLSLGGNAAEVPYCAATNDKPYCEAGGIIELEAPTAGGYTVTATTGDIISVNNEDGAVAGSYEITFLGCEA